MRLQIENQVSDEKQCGHQDGKVTVPREDFIEKLRACRLAFEELASDDGVIVARTDLLGAGLTQKVPVSRRPGDLGFGLHQVAEDAEPIGPQPPPKASCAIWKDGKFVRPVRMTNGLFAFREGTGRARVIEDCILVTQSRAAPIWSGSRPTRRTSTEIAAMVAEIRKQAPKAKLAYNNSPSFNWTLNLRRQVFDAYKEAGKDVSKYNRAELMKVELRLQRRWRPRPTSASAPSRRMQRSAPASSTT